MRVAAVCYVCMNTIALDSTVLAHVNNMPFMSCLLGGLIFVSMRMHHSNGVAPDASTDPGASAAGAAVGAVGAVACAGADTFAGVNDAASVGSRIVGCI